MSNYKYFSAFIIAILFAACDKKNDTPTPTDPKGKTGTVSLRFKNVAGNEPLVLNSRFYKTTQGDSFKVSKFDYYISNIKLNGSSTFAENESYHLVKQSDAASQEFSIANVPEGKYSSITFTLGVDSLRNVSGAQTGALDPVNGMFWSWNTGYIMLKMEGMALKSTQPDNKVVFHLGGFSGVNSAVKIIKLNFAQPMEISSTKHSIYLQADVVKLLSTPNGVDFLATHTIHMPSAASAKLAVNAAAMFTLLSIEKQ